MTPDGATTFFDLNVEPVRVVSRDVVYESWFS